MGSHHSWLERAMDLLKPQPEPPLIRALPIEPSAWRQAVEETHVVPGLTVHDIGLSVFGETRSLSDRPGSNENLDAARLKIAHAMINDAELSHLTAKPRNKVHDPLQPAEKVLRNIDEQTAYESSLRAARDAYLSGHDPTNGAIYFYLAKTPSRANQIYSAENKVGVRISTQSGPYSNSFPQGDTGSRAVWLNTYLPDENDRKIRRHHSGRR